MIFFSKANHPYIYLYIYMRVNKLYSVIENAYDEEQIRNLLQRAESELYEETRKATEDGATSKRFSRKKVTIE